MPIILQKVIYTTIEKIYNLYKTTQNPKHKKKKNYIQNKCKTKYRVAAYTHFSTNCTLLQHNYSYVMMMMVMMITISSKMLVQYDNSYFEFYYLLSFLTVKK